MALVDEIQSLLGLVPTRDRAGIQRGTMADEAAARADGNVEGQTLTRQAMVPAAPPRLMLPPGMGGPGPTPEDAIQVAGPGGFGGPKLVPTRGDTKAVVPPVVGSTGDVSAAPPPAPRERVVAASPAAAPSPAVTRGSDIILQAMEEEKRRAKMQQLFNGLGLLANGLFNRDADSSNATQRALLAGGGGGKGGTDIGTLKTLLDMRKEEDNAVLGAQRRESAIQLIMSKERKSREEAELLVDSDKYKDYLGPEYARKREADSREQAMRQELLDRTDQIAAELKLPAFQVRAAILAGDGQKILDMLNPTTRAALESTRTTTAKTAQDTKITGADYGRREDALNKPEETAARLSEQLGRKVHPNEVRQAAQTEQSWQDFNKEQTTGRQTGIIKDQYETQRIAEETKRKRQTAMSYEAALARPDLLAEDLDLTPTQVRNGLRTPEAFEKLISERSGTSTPTLQEFEDDRRRYAARGEPFPYKDLPSWQLAKQRQVVESPEDKIRAKQTEMASETINKRLAEDETTSRNSVNTININKLQQNKWDENLPTGGWGADTQLKFRQTVARLYGIPDAEADNTQSFMMLAKERIRAKAKSLPGALSEKELTFLEEGTGGMMTSPGAHKTMAAIQEKIERAEIIARNNYVDQQMANPRMRGIAENYRKVDLPEPGRFLREEVEANKALAMDLRADPSSENKAQYDEQFGPGMAEYVISKPKKWIDGLKD